MTDGSNFLQFSQAERVAASSVTQTPRLRHTGRKTLTEIMSAAHRLRR